MIKRGEIYIANYKGNRGSCADLNGRAVVVVSNDIGNEYSNIVTIVPLTTAQKKKDYPMHVSIESAPRHSIAMCESVTTVPKSCLGSRIGKLTWWEMRDVSAALLIALGVI